MQNPHGSRRSLPHALFALLATGALLAGPGATAAPTDPVSVVLAPEGVGEIFSPGIRLVADLDQDYVEEEFFVSGASAVYTYDAVPVPGSIVVLDAAVPYTTRIVVRRPMDAGVFNGTVVIEWWNSTAGFDTAPSWDSSAEYFARKGIVYVGVTNSTTSFEHLTSGCSVFGLPPTCGTRYSALTMTANGQAFEMVSQIANMLKNDATANNPLFPDYPVDRIFHAGQSQQGGSVVTYATAFHFAANDGYFIQAAGTARPINFSCPCEETDPDVCVPSPYPACTPTLQGADRLVATDLPVPVMRAQTENDMERSVLPRGTRQADTVSFRYYELTGTAHSTVHKGIEVLPAGDPFFLEEACQFELNTFADGPIFGSYLYNAMWENLEEQVRFGTPLPAGDLLEVDPGDATLLARDELGNALGGIRLPQLDLPTATYGSGNVVDPGLPGLLSFIGNLVCGLSGSVDRFDDATLAGLYPDRAEFVDQFNQKLDELIAARFLLVEDADRMRLFVESKEQQVCLNGLHKGMAKVAKAQGKELCGCLRDGGKGTLEPGATIEDCTTADRRGKVARAMEKTVRKTGSACLTPPDFGARDAATIHQIALAKELDLFHEVFGPSLDAAVTGPDKCQLAAAKQAKRCQDSWLSHFDKCARKGLKKASVHDTLTLANCIGDDPRGRIEKACGSKLDRKVEKACAGLDHATLFPGACGAEETLADFSACLGRLVGCRACLALNEADGLEGDCDALDDGTLNASCS